MHSPTALHNDTDPSTLKGGIAQFFSEKRDVAWVALILILLWGWFAFTQLGQQEDPSIPIRSSVLVTTFPGATAAKMESLVTEKLEKKITELESINEIASESRPGVSVININLRSSTQNVDQEWDKIRAKIAEVALPEGYQAPFLDTSFGKTIALLMAIASPPLSDGECLARANLLETRLAALRKGLQPEGRAAIVQFFPSSMSEEYRQFVTTRFAAAAQSNKDITDLRLNQGPSCSVAEFSTSLDRKMIEHMLSALAHNIFGSDELLMPDMEPPLIIMGGENVANQVRASAPPRYRYRELELMAKKLEDELKQIPSVGRVSKLGTVEERVFLYFSQAQAFGPGMAANEIINAIGIRNALIPGGILQTDLLNLPIELTGEFARRQELLNTVVGVTPKNTPIYLRDIFDVRRSYEDPLPMLVDVYRRPAAEGPGLKPRGVSRTPLTPGRAVLLSVEMKEGEKIGAFNAAVRAAMAKVRPALSDDVDLVTLSDQPKAVADKLRHFITSFIEAVLIVIIVSIFLMDFRSALVVAAAVPLTVALTLAGMQIFHIPLHQISVASLIIALGLLVDDPVVAADGINREMAQGRTRQVAAWLGPFKLRRPILFGTIINILAFLPLILLPDETGEFVFAIPVVVTVALIASRLVSMTFVPLLGYYLLRGQKGLEDKGAQPRSFVLVRWVDLGLLKLMPRYRQCLTLALRHPYRTLAVGYGIFLASFGLIPFFGTQFFPSADRNQFLIDITLQESSALQSTERICRQVMETVRRYDEIESAAVFIGGTAPCFYYNVAPKTPDTRLGQILVNTERADQAPGLIARLRRELDGVAGARCVVKSLEQGPPVGEPIQIRISGDNLDELRRLADSVAAILRQAGAYKVHDDLGTRVPTLRVSIDQERANTLGVQNAQIGQALQAAFRGIKVTELREDDHLVPVVVRLRSEERNRASAINNLYVETSRQKTVPLSSFARVDIDAQFASLPRFQQLRTVTVRAYSSLTELPSAVLARAQSQLEDVPLPAGYRLEYAGEDKEMKKSMNAMMGVVFISIAAILMTLIVQFESLAKSLTIMLTVPLGLIGTFAGLAFSNSSFGFMAMLGVVSLTGVIISHIIVLSDFIEEARAEGYPLEEALVHAGLARLRPVLVTVLATVGGLIPLYLTGGSLWHALTAVHIFGLIFATALTLLVLPVFYLIFAQRFGWIK